MKEINDKNIDLDALFEGKPYDLLDADTQAYVLVEFGSREEYETMSSSFKRIRSVITEEKEIVADAKVKKDLLALFNEDENRKVVPLIPGKTGGLGFIRSPYFQMAVAASLVIVALFFIPWNGKQDAQLALNEKGLKEEAYTENKVAEEPTDKTTADASTSTTPEGYNRTTENAGANSQGPREDVAPGELVEESIMDDKISAGEQVPEADKNLSHLEDEKYRKEEGKISKAEKTVLMKPNNNNVVVSDELSKRQKNELFATSKDSTKDKKKSDDNEDASTKGEINAGTIAPASVTGKKPVNGISLGEKKDLMQFFNTAL